MSCGSPPYSGAIRFRLALFSINPRLPDIRDQMALGCADPDAADRNFGAVGLRPGWSHHVVARRHRRCYFCHGGGFPWLKSGAFHNWFRAFASPAADRRPRKRSSGACMCRWFRGFASGRAIQYAKQMSCRRMARTAPDTSLGASMSRIGGWGDGALSATISSCAGRRHEAPTPPQESAC